MQKRAGRVVQMVQGKHDALSLNPSTTKKEKKNSQYPVGTEKLVISLTFKAFSAPSPAEFIGPH
jgi:hypothetical protein